MPLFEVRLAIFQLNCSQLALQDRDEEIAAAACRLQKSGIDPLGLAFDQVKHLLDEPGRREDFAMISDALL